MPLNAGPSPGLMDRVQRPRTPVREMMPNRNPAGNPTMGQGRPMQERPINFGPNPQTWGNSNPGMQGGIPGRLPMQGGGIPLPRNMTSGMPPPPMGGMPPPLPMGGMGGMNPMMGNVGMPNQPGPPPPQQLGGMGMPPGINDRMGGGLWNRYMGGR